MSDPKPNAAPPRETPGQPDKANGTKMITVGCKLPNGLICELGKPGDDDYTRVVLRGANDANIAGGYGLTPNVSEAFWNAWLKKNARLEFVKKALVFAQTDEASARDHAVDLKDRKSGLEPLDPTIKVMDKESGLAAFEMDANHFAQGRRDVAQAQRDAARGG